MGSNESRVNSNFFDFEIANAEFTLVCSMMNKCQNLCEEKKLDSLKEAFKLYNLCVTILKDIQNYTSKLSQISFHDLSREFIEFCSRCCLAQSQELASLIAYLETKSSKLLCKLYTCAATLYRECIIFYNTNTIFKYAKKQWPLILNCKMKYCAALADIFQADFNICDSDYSEGLARLKTCVEHCDEGIEYLGGKFLIGLATSLEHIKIIAHNAFKLADRDNSLIFHQEVRKKSDLQNLEKIQMYSQRSMESIFSEFISDNKDDNIFEGILSINFMQILSKYTDEKTKLVKYQEKCFQDSKSKFLNLCSKNDLPEKLIDFITDHDDLKLFQMRNNVEKEGISFEFFVKFKNFELKHEILFDLIIDSIEKEEHEFINYSKMYPRTVIESPNLKLTEFYADIHLLRQKANSIVPQLVKYKSEIDEDFLYNLKNFLEKQHGVINSSSIKNQIDISGLYSNVKKLIDNTESFLKDFKGEILKDENLENSLLRWNADYEIYIQKELSKYEPICSEIDSKIKLLEDEIKSFSAIIEDKKTATFISTASLNILKSKTYTEKLILIFKNIRYFPKLFLVMLKSSITRL